MSGIETPLSKSIREALTARGAIVTRVQSGILPVAYPLRKGANPMKSRRVHYVHCAPEGTPDIHVEFERSTVRGLSAGWGYGWGEVKPEGEELRTAQRIWHAKAIEQGRNVAVWRSIREALRDLEIWRKL